MEEFQEDTKKTSKINSAIDQVYRFGEIWRNAYRHRLQRDFNSWNVDLDTMWSELASDLQEKYSTDKKKIEDIFDKIREFNKSLLKFQPLISGSSGTGFNKPNEKDLKRISMQYIILQNKEICIRQIQNDLGKGTSWDTGDDDDID